MNEFRLNRVFSKPITACLMPWPVSPNMVTTVSLLCGISAGLLFTMGRYWPALIASLLYQLAVILDNCDGEIARAKKLGSPFGAIYDIVADFLTDFCLFAGIGLGAARAGIPGPVVLFTTLCLSGGIMHFLLVLLEKKRGFGPAAFGAPHPEHGRRKGIFLNFFDALREGDASWFIFLFAAAGQTPMLLWAGGVYMQVLWISALIVNYRWLFK